MYLLNTKIRTFFTDLNKNTVLQLTLTIKDSYGFFLSISVKNTNTKSITTVNRVETGPFIYYMQFDFFPANCYLETYNKIWAKETEFLLLKDIKI